MGIPGEGTYSPQQNRRLDEHGFETIRAEFVGADLDRHLALFYESRDLQLTVAAAFVDHTLTQGKQCLYLVDDNTADAVETALRAAGIDVERRVADGDLVIRDAESVYLDAEFDPETLLETLDERTDESIAEGYEGLGVVGENTWCFHTAGTFDRILEFEAQFDTRCPDLPITALCQYDLTRFSEESIAKALWTHRQIIYRGRLCQNPYYVPPEEYTDSRNPELNARLMLEQTYDLSQAQRGIQQREQRLAVLNRALRHNIRNDLNIIAGYLELIGDRTDLSATEREWLTTARQHVDDVVEMAEKARHIERTLSNSRVEPTDLGEVIEEVTATIEAEFPDARVSVSGDRHVTVLTDTNLDVALLELATNAIVHQKTETPSVTFDVATPTEGPVRLEIRNPGPPIPDQDRRALREGRETALEHSSGLGLWIVKWVVEEAHGSLYFPNGDEECRVGIELPRVTN
ncbi:MEDS domain-containing protein [Natronomonas halophila]|uniref:MEDS domain-containing protein n=1 Tax=Natronomonas halophila TaxID=2747817 RepID=UPI0015B63337|nr:MEDS domain-containing protein [Natronomonas halophila]QLD85964.1 MEDS domain-containing protein [Natronomonas halophila]